MKELVRYFMRQAPWRLALGGAFGVASGLVGAFLAVLIGQHLDGRAGWGVDLFAASCIAFLVMKSCCDLVLLRLTQAAVLGLRTDLSRNLLEVPFAQQQRVGAARLNAMLTRDADTIVTASTLIPLAFSNLVLIVGCFAYLLWISPLMFVLVASVLLVATLIYRRAEEAPRANLRRVREQLDELYTQFGTLVGGAKELQLNAVRGKFMVEQCVLPAAKKVSEAHVSAMTGYMLISNAGVATFYLLIGLALYVAAGSSVGASAAAAMTVVLLYLVRPIGELVAVLPQLRQASIALARVQGLGAVLASAMVTDHGEDPFPSGEPVMIELENVERKYPGDGNREFKVGPLNLVIRSGEAVFIVGGNGSGKTTLAMLLSGLYAPDGGHIRLNGVRVDSTNQAWYRSRFSAVFSDFQLFEHVFDAANEKIELKARKHLKQLGMDDKVCIESGRYSTTRLSSGQRRRLAMVSAFSEDRPVYLFDEWAADQDPVFRRRFYAEIIPTLRSEGKAVIVISHDDAYFDRADRVLRMQDGQFVEIPGTA